MEIEQKRRLCGNPACPRSRDENGDCALLMLKDVLTIQNYRDYPKTAQKAMNNCALTRDAKELVERANPAKMEET